MQNLPLTALGNQAFGCVSGPVHDFERIVCAKASPRLDPCILENIVSNACA
jgi:hypothetical protein